MSVSHDAVRELLGAWALDALLPGEEEQVLAHVAACEDCAAEAGSLREVVRGLGDTRPAADGAGGRGGAPATALLESAVRRRPATPSAAEYAAPYAAAVAALDALLDEVEERAAWHTPVVHGWDVRGTLAHLIAADEPLGLRAGAECGMAQPRRPGPAGAPGTSPPAGPDGWRDDWAARTAEVVAYEAGFPPAETRIRWRERSRALLASPAAQDPQAAAAGAVMLGMRLPLAEHFLVRAFETWVHTDDIGRALDIPVPPPLPAHLDRLVGLALRLLQAAFAEAAVSVRLTVTGYAGVVLGSSEDSVRAELALDPIDFCLLVGGRLSPGQALRDVTGDRGVAGSVLDQAASLAWL